LFIFNLLGVEFFQLQQPDAAIGFFLFAFKFFLGVALAFEGEGVNEVVKVAKIEGDNAPALTIGQVVVRVDPRYFRPTEVETLLGDPSKAKKDLGWVPEITLDEMVQEMVAHDLRQAKQHALLKQHGYNVAVGVER
jgi:GDPmannose 4,6-dehydratase